MMKVRGMRFEKEYNICRHRITSGVKNLFMFQDGKEKPKDHPLTASSFDNSAAGPALSTLAPAVVNNSFT